MENRDLDALNVLNVLSKDSGTLFDLISKDTVIGTILDSAPETAPFFLEMGMHCLGCPSARSETVAQACMVHGVNAADLVSKINAFLADK